jgi:hypothetical protein
MVLKFSERERIEPSLCDLQILLTKYVLLSGAEDLQMHTREKASERERERERVSVSETVEKNLKNEGVNARKAGLWFKCGASCGTSTVEKQGRGMESKISAAPFVSPTGLLFQFKSQRLSYGLWPVAIFYYYYYLSIWYKVSSRDMIWI